MLSTIYIIISLLSKCLYSLKSDTAAAVGQNPSIVITPNSPTFNPHVFLIYNSAQGLDSMYCQDPMCYLNTQQTLKCGVKVYSTALIAIDHSSYSYSGCQKTIREHITSTEKILYCTYYMVVGYGLNSHSRTSYVSFIICYDNECSIQNKEEVIIDTMFDSNSPSDTFSKPFAYSISLTTYTDERGIYDYPMFTYSKYSTDLKQFILNVIICLDFFCSTWIGKSKRSFASHPPYLVLGVKPGGDGSIAKGVVSIKETWSNKKNYASIMFTKNVNITDNKTSAQNVYVLAIGTCALNSSHWNPCKAYPSAELYTTIINKQIVSINTVSMTEYIPQNDEDVSPLFITAYVVNKNGLNELWLLYCFDIYCSLNLTTHYCAHTSKLIDYPVITLSAVSYHPNIVFFENSTSLMVMSCGGGLIGWNCTQDMHLHPTNAIFSDTQFQTASMHMQISVTNNYKNEEQTQSFILFSQVLNSGGGAGIYNGSIIINCKNSFCTLNSGGILLPFDMHMEQFTTSLDITVFVIMSWILTFITIFGILSIYKCISPSAFMSRNVMNAYLNSVSLDPSRIRPLSYWFFFANTLCSAMCVVPWFAYFNVSDFKLYSFMIIAPFVSVIVTLLVLITLHICPLTKATTNVLAFISIVYYLSTILLSYSFSVVWNLQSQNCQTSDLSGLKYSILTGHIATCLVVQYLLFWNIRCFQAIRLASPERLKEGALYFMAKNNSQCSHVTHIRPKNDDWVEYKAVNEPKPIQDQD